MKLQKITNDDSVNYVQSANSSKSEHASKASSPQSEHVAKTASLPRKQLKTFTN